MATPGPETRPGLKIARIPDLVLDSKLRTTFVPNLNETIHTYEESNPTSRRRVVSRTEHWKRQKKIGRGSCGSVWLEKCIKGKRETDLRAVKKIETTRRFSSIHYIQELEAIAKFSHSRYERCFVKSFGWYESPDALFIVMEHLELGDLWHYLYDRPPLPVTEAREIAFQILEGLVMMHENEFAHRDLKPNNILVKSHPPDEWWIKITDFGISKRVEEVSGISTTLKGTRGYIAPELYGFTENGSPYATDIWSLGTIVFQLVTKELVFPKIPPLVKYTETGVFPPREVGLLEAKLSQLGIDFVQCLMRPIPQDRPTAETAIELPWMKEDLPHESSSAETKTTHSFTERHLRSHSAATQEDAKDTQIASLSESTTEEFASLNTRVAFAHPGSSSPTSNRSLKSFNSSTNMTANEIETISQLVADDGLMTVLSAIRSSDLPSSTTGKFFGGNYWRMPSWMQPQRFINTPPSSTTTGLNDGPELKMGKLGSLELFGPFQGADCPVNALAFSHDSALLAAGFDNSYIRIWDLIGSKDPRDIRSRVIRGFGGPISAMATSSRDGGLLASCPLSKPIIRIYRFKESTQATHMDLYPDADLVPFTSLSFSPDGIYLVAIDSEGRITYWNVETRRWLGMLEHDSPCQAIVFSPGSQTIISISHTRLCLWNAKTKTKLEDYGIPPSAGPMTLASTGDTFVTVTWKDAQCFITCFNQTGVPLLNIRSNTVKALALSPARNALHGHMNVSLANNMLASIDEYGHIAVHNINTGDIYESEALVNDPKLLAFSPDGRFLASSSLDGKVWLWNTLPLGLWGPPQPIYEMPG